MSTYLFDVIAISGIFLIAAAMYMLIRDQKSVTGQRAKEHLSKKLDQYLSVAESVIETTVIKLSETVVKDLREASEDGKLTKEEGAQVFNTAVETVKRILGTVFIEFISEYMGDFDAWLEQEIEKYVKHTKEGSVTLRSRIVRE